MKSLNDNNDFLPSLQSNAAEFELVATLTAQPDLLDEISLDYTEFGNANAGLVYRTISYFYENDVAVTPSLIISKLANRIETETLVSLVDASIAKTWAVKELAKQVRNESRRRKIYKTTLKLREIAETAIEIDDSAISEIESSIAEISISKDDESDMRNMNEVLDEYVSKLAERRNKRDGLVGVDTGFKQLNYQIGGWCPGSLCIIAARPSVGKTAVMIQSALSACLKDVAIMFSLEMNEEEISKRVTATSTLVDMFHLRNAKIDDASWERVKLVKDLIQSNTLILNSKSSISPEYIRSRVRRFKKKMNDPTKRIVVFADYLQIMQYTQKTRSRAEEVGKISTELKAIAKDLNVCVVALAQLNRNVEHTQDKRPTLSDIRESGQIEQDADVVMLLYREDYYDEQKNEDVVVPMEMIVAKNRNGERGTVQLVYNKENQHIASKYTGEGRSDPPA